MPRTNLYNKQAISPVIATILLIAITVIIAVGVYQFLQNYTQDSLDSTSNNQLLNDLNTKVVDANDERAYIQTPYENLNISRVLLDGTECSNNSGISTLKTLELNLSSCSDNVTSSRPQLTIESNEGIIQLQIRELRAVSSSSSSGGGGSPSFDSYCWLNDDKSSCESNFVVDGCGTGTVLDGGTGLCWQQDMGGSTMNWTDAQLNCTDSSTAGHSDWYLPSKEELMTLTDLSRSDPAIVGGNNNIFTNVESSYYWTDTSRGYNSPSSYAWAVHFDAGNGNTRSETSTYYASCVRRN